MRRVHHALTTAILAVGFIGSAAMSGNALAMWPAKIRVTDIKDFTQVLTEVDFEKSDDFRAGPFGLEVLLVSTSPAKRAWVEYSQITTLSLNKASQGLEASIALPSGDVLKGLLADRGMRISGKSDLGKTVLKIEDLKRVEIIELIKYEYDKEQPVLQKNAAESWRTGWMKGGDRWSLTDGGKTIEIIDPQIRDTYKTNRDGFMIWFGKSLRVSHQRSGFMVERGVSKIEVSLKDWEAVDLLATPNTAPEIVLSKADGSQVTAKIVMSTKEQYDSSEKVETTYGAIDPEDMIIWRVPYGFEGVSLLPERKLRLSRMR